MQHDSCEGCFGASFDTRMWCAGCVDFSRWEDPSDPKDRCKECDAVINGYGNGDGNGDGDG